MKRRSLMEQVVTHPAERGWIETTHCIFSTHPDLTPIRRWEIHLGWLLTASILFLDLEWDV